MKKDSMFFVNNENKSAIIKSIALFYGVNLLFEMFRDKSKKELSKKFLLAYDKIKLPVYSCDLNAHDLFIVFKYIIKLLKEQGSEIFLEVFCKNSSNVKKTTKALFKTFLSELEASEESEDIFKIEKPDDMYLIANKYIYEEYSNDILQNMSKMLGEQTEEIDKTTLLTIFINSCIGYKSISNVLMAIKDEFRLKLIEYIFERKAEKRIDFLTKLESKNATRKMMKGIILLLDSYESISLKGDLNE